MTSEDAAAPAPVQSVSDRVNVRIFSDVCLNGKRMTHMALPLSDNIFQRYRPWVVCFVGALFFFYGFLQMQMFSAINQPLRDTFAVDATQLSVLSSSYLWGDLLWLLPAGIILDRYPVRRVILLAMICCIGSTAGFALSPSVLMATISHGLTGSASAFCLLSCVALTSKWLPSDRQAQAMGWVVTIAFAGGLLAQAPLASLTQLLGWRQALWWDVLLGVVLWLLMWILLEDAPGRPGATQAGGLTFRGVCRSLTKVISNPQNHCIGWYIALLNLPVMVICALWGSALLQTVYDLETVAANQVVSMILIGSIVGCPVVGYWSDRSGTRRFPMLMGALASLFCISILMLGADLGVWQLSALFFVLGFATSSQIIGYPMITESNPSELTATANSLASLIIMTSAAFGQVIFGRLLDLHWSGQFAAHQRVYTAGDYNFAMWLFPLAFMFATIAAFVARETFDRAPAQGMR